jgi:hypothetical protein
MTVCRGPDRITRIPTICAAYATVDVALSEPRALLAIGAVFGQKGREAVGNGHRKRESSRGLIRSFAVQVRHRRRWRSSSSRTTPALTMEILAGNGGILAQSEGFVSYEDAEQAARHVRDGAASASFNPAPGGTRRLISQRAAARATHAMAPCARADHRSGAPRRSAPARRSTNGRRARTAPRARLAGRIDHCHWGHPRVDATS